MIKNKKGILILIVSFIALYLIINIIYIIPKGKKYKNTVFLGSSTKVSINKGTISVYNEDKQLRKQNVKVYFKNKIIDGTISSEKVPSSGVINSYYVQDLNNFDLYYDKVLIAYTPDISIDIKNDKSYTSKDLTTLYEFANSNSIDISDTVEIIQQNVTTMDIDEDDNDEYIYSISLVETYGLDDDSEEISEEYYTVVFLKNEGKYYLIDSEVGDYDEISNTQLSFVKLIDFNNDGDYEFVIKKQMTEYGPYYYELYNFDGNEFTKIGGE